MYDKRQGEKHDVLYDVMWYLQGAAEIIAIMAMEAFTEKMIFECKHLRKWWNKPYWYLGIASVKALEKQLAGCQKSGGGKCRRIKC